MHTDIGIQKARNQDSVLVKTARTRYGPVLMSAICDGMGGLSKGELASGTLVQMLAKWFEEELPVLLERGLKKKELWKSWRTLLNKANNKIQGYGKEHHIKLGTTITVLLLAEHNFYVVNVGDSRIYQLHRTIKQLTRDQTFIEREVELGHLTKKEARTDPRRNILLQCIGATSEVVPRFCQGKIKKNSMFLVCSDGFCHAISKEELLQHLRPMNLEEGDSMKQKLVYLTELNKVRGETDNISSILIRVKK